MADTALRGRCREMAEKACAADPSLTLVRGWYADPLWGDQEHWWGKRPDGTIVDPTAAQFPVPGVTAWYREYEGLFPCRECGAEFAEGEGYMECCSGSCYGRMVGVPCVDVRGGPS